MKNTNFFLSKFFKFIIKINYIARSSKKKGDFQGEKPWCSTGVSQPFLPDLEQKSLAGQNLSLKTLVGSRNKTNKPGANPNWTNSSNITLIKH
jgi:hypothetical protein